GLPGTPASQCGEGPGPLCRPGGAGEGEPVLFHAARPPQLSRPGHHRSHPRRAPAARSDRRQATGAFTSATWLARAADRAWLCLSRSDPELGHMANPTSLGAPVATTVANRLAGTAVLE